MLDSLTLSQSQRALMEQATATYERQVTPALASYLTGRGIDKDAALGARLGLCDEPITGHEQYRGRLAIPFLTRAGVVALRFRDLTGTSKAKYLGAFGQQTKLYNAGVLAEGPSTVAICEGELDAIVMQHRIGIPAVGVSGVGSWKAHYPRCFADVRRILIVFDNDDGEKNAGQSAAQMIQRDIPQATNILPPPGMDVSEWFVADGADSIREVMGLQWRYTEK